MAALIAVTSTLGLLRGQHRVDVGAQGEGRSRRADRETVGIHALVDRVRDLTPAGVGDDGEPARLGVRIGERIVEEDREGRRVVTGHRDDRKAPGEGEGACRRDAHPQPVKGPGPSRRRRA
jgi:hypothetical protein